jgi:hypothetical protein
MRTCVRVAGAQPIRPVPALARDSAPRRRPRCRRRRCLAQRRRRARNPRPHGPGGRPTLRQGGRSVGRQTPRGDTANDAQTGPVGGGDGRAAAPVSRIATSDRTAPLSRGALPGPGGSPEAGALPLTQPGRPSGVLTLRREREAQVGRLPTLAGGGRPPNRRFARPALALLSKSLSQYPAAGRDPWRDLHALSKRSLNVVAPPPMATLIPPARGNMIKPRPVIWPSGRVKVERHW